MSPYIPKKAKIIDVRDETPDIKFIRVKHGIKHDPGQFIELSILGYGEITLGITSHSDKHLDLYVRNVGNTTNALHNLKKGNDVFIRGPYGKGFPMKKMKGKSLVIIGGGTGVVPLKSVIEYVKKDRYNYHGVNIYLGFRDYENIIFKKEIKELSKKFNLKITLDKKDKRWSGSVGQITKLIEKAKIDEGSKILLCGPPIMMKFVIETLHNKGIKDNDIYVSYERMMSCGIGKCGHCMIKGIYVCKDGPVFRYDYAKDLID
jgi:anaerobic sulfite reductase subunit B